MLNTLGSRKVVLEAELKEIDEDITQNTLMSRKYGEEVRARCSGPRERGRATAPASSRIQHSLMSSRPTAVFHRGLRETRADSGAQRPPGTLARAPGRCL